MRQGSEDTDLAVVDLAHPAIPLPGNAGGALTLLGKTALVDDQRPASLGKALLGLDRALAEDTRVIPIRRAQHVVHPLVVAAGDDIGHAFHVASPCLIEAPYILPRAVLDAACRRPEVLAERGEVRLKLVGDRSDKRGDASDILRPS